MPSFDVARRPWADIVISARAADIRHLVQLVQEQALPKMPGERTRQMDGCQGG
jgi:hypothetical protein